MSSLNSTSPVLLTIWLLGRFALSVEGCPVTPPSKKARWLLALLALRRGKETERLWLAETLWPESSPEKALFNLRQLLVELRRALGSAAVCLRSPTPRSLMLDSERVWVDTEAFRAQAHASQPDIGQKALDLYGGLLLPECAEDWVQAEREALSQSYLELLETLSQQARAAQAYSTATMWLRRLVQADPYRESAHRALMETLAEAGDRAAYEQVYQELRRKLRHELNIEPSPETTQLYQHLQGAALVVALAPSPLPAKASRGYLPIPLTGLIDREEALQEVSVALERNRLVTLIGPGGMGKTRIAIAVAHQKVSQFEGGVWFVDLAALTQPELVLQRVLSSLGIKAEASLPLEEILVQTLTTTEILVVLDNCEHVLEACRRVVSLLLSRCPRLILLATSRENLGITGEQVYPVSPLRLPPRLPPTAREKNPQVLLEYSAVRLFVERALQVSPRFTLTARNAESVAQICRQLDGLPLALEMAAARVRSLSVQEVEQRLVARFQLLTSGSKSALSRHQTLRGLIDWSFSLLTEPEQVLFRRLAVFSGGWTLEAAEAVVDLPDALELLLSLVDKSLVMVEPTETETRYRMLETIYEYAREQLEYCPERTRIQERQLEFYRSLAVVLEESEAAEDRQRVEREQENLRKALDWARSPGGNLEKGLLLARHLYWYWYDKFYYEEGYYQLKSLCDQVPPETKTQLYSTLMRRLGDMAFRIGHEEEALVYLDRSITLDQELREPGWEGRGHYLRTAPSLVRGELATARHSAQEALRCFRQAGDTSWEAAALTQLANVARQSGALEEALTWIDTAEVIRKDGRLTLQRALVWMEQGRYREARQSLESALQEESRIATELLIPLVDLDRREGCLDLAASHLSEHLRQVLSVGDRVGMVRGLELAALLLGPYRPAALLLAATAAFDPRVRPSSYRHNDEVTHLRAQLQEQLQATPLVAPSLEQATTLALEWLAAPLKGYNPP